DGGKLKPPWQECDNSHRLVTFPEFSSTSRLDNPEGLNGFSRQMKRMHQSVRSSEPSFSVAFAMARFRNRPTWKRSSNSSQTVLLLKLRFGTALAVNRSHELPSSRHDDHLSRSSTCLFQ